MRLLTKAPVIAVVVILFLIMSVFVFPAFLTANDTNEMENSKKADLIKDSNVIGATVYADEVVAVENKESEDAAVDPVVVLSSAEILGTVDEDLYLQLKDSEIYSNETKRTVMRDIISAKVRQLFSEKYEIPAEEVETGVSLIDDNHASGGVSFKGVTDVSGGWFLSAKTREGWIIVQDVNDSRVIMCRTIAPYGFSVEMVPSCYDETSASVHYRTSADITTTD